MKGGASRTNENTAPFGIQDYPKEYSLDVLVAQLVNHPLYKNVASVEDAKRFMEYQVWCVWDFMTLAKSVQIAIGNYTVPWVPPIDASLVAAINTIIAGEEADEWPDAAQHASHLDVFLAAMREAKASTAAISEFLNDLRGGIPYEQAMARPTVPHAAREFVNTTMSIANGPVHARVACLCLTREELVPRMFMTLIPNLPQADQHLKIFMWYLNRHVQLDIEVHGPLSKSLMERIVGNDLKRHDDAQVSMNRALLARLKYLNATLDYVEQSRRLAR